ncbi:MAG: 10 kDa chaperonin [Syntrophomonadaceae bacterium]|nr:10 kDa chaperonin [Bacillota bacterium]
MRTEIERVSVSELVRNFPYKLYSQRVVAYEIEIETVGGLYIPMESRRDGEMRTNEGYVIAVGDDVNFCKVGDIILYGRYSGAWQEVDGKRYRFMNEEDILAKRRMG